MSGTVSNSTSRKYFNYLISDENVKAVAKKVHFKSFKNVA